MDNLTKIFWKNEAVRLNKELDKEKAKFDKFVEDLKENINDFITKRIEVNEESKDIHKDLGGRKDVFGFLCDELKFTKEELNEIIDELSSKQEKMK
jgi:hypothetical protein